MSASAASCNHSSCTRRRIQRACFGKHLVPAITSILHSSYLPTPLSSYQPQHQLHLHLTQLSLSRLCLWMSRELSSQGRHGEPGGRQLSAKMGTLRRSHRIKARREAARRRTSEEEVPSRPEPVKFWVMPRCSGHDCSMYPWIHAAVLGFCNIPASLLAAQGLIRLQSLGQPLLI